MSTYFITIRDPDTHASTLSLYARLKARYLGLSRRSFHRHASEEDRDDVVRVRPSNSSF